MTTNTRVTYKQLRTHRKLIQREGVSKFCRSIDDIGIFLYEGGFQFSDRG